tara:strand:+ start:472 stop:753 length:282 start_codon:yes stop_codon:yes gene_type:complete
VDNSQWQIIHVLNLDVQLIIILKGDWARLGAGNELIILLDRRKRGIGRRVVSIELLVSTNLSSAVNGLVGVVVAGGPLVRVVDGRHCEDVFGD